MLFLLGLLERERDVLSKCVELPLRHSTESFDSSSSRLNGGGLRPASGNRQCSMSVSATGGLANIGESSSLGMSSRSVSHQFGLPCQTCRSSLSGKRRCCTRMLSTQCRTTVTAPVAPRCSFRSLPRQCLPAAGHNLGSRSHLLTQAAASIVNIPRITAAGSYSSSSTPCLNSSLQGSNCHLACDTIPTRRRVRVNSTASHRQAAGSPEGSQPDEAAAGSSSQASSRECGLGTGGSLRLPRKSNANAQPLSDAGPDGSKGQLPPIPPQQQQVPQPPRTKRAPRGRVRSAHQLHKVSCPCYHIRMAMSCNTAACKQLLRCVGIVGWYLYHASCLVALWAYS